MSSGMRWADSSDEEEEIAVVMPQMSQTAGLNDGTIGTHVSKIAAAGFTDDEDETDDESSESSDSGSDDEQQAKSETIAPELPVEILKAPPQRALSKKELKAKKRS